MRAFIVRAFNVQSGVDFEAVERLLIGPALGAFGIDGRTAQEIVAQGNIRADMLQFLSSCTPCRFLYSTWEQSIGARTYSFLTRKGVRFHDYRTVFR
jgi:ABC-type transport system substrate-binding protein